MALSRMDGRNQNAQKPALQGRVLMGRTLRAPLIRAVSIRAHLLALLSTLLLLQSAWIACAQSGSQNLLRLSEYQKNNWQVEAGLPSNDIHMIVQQRDGRLLLATAAGLCTFDGRVFEAAEGPTARTLSYEPANAVLLDRDGVLWVGTDGRGVLREADGRVTNVSRAAGRMHERVRMLYQDQRGAIWIATQNGVERYWNGRLQALDTEGMIAGDLTMPFADDGTGGILMVTSRGLFHWVDGSVSTVALPPGVGRPSAVYRDNDGHEWLGTMRGAVRLALQGGHWAVDGALLPTLSPVTTMLSDRLDSLWVGTRRNGLYRESTLGWEHFGVADGLPDGGVKTLFLDDESNLWVGMLTGGLSRWREGAFAPYGQPEGFPSHYAAAAFADSRGALWLGTWDKGLFRLQNDKLEAMTLPGNPRESPIRAIAEDRAGYVWVGTWFHGVYRYENGHFHSFLLGTESPGNAVSALVCDRQGGLWVGTYEGVLYYPKGLPEAGQHTFLRQQLVTAMAEDTDGSILVGTLQGLFRLSGNGVRSNPSPIHGLEGQHILSVFTDRLGTAWAASLESGLVQIAGGGSIRQPTQKYKTEPVAFPAIYSATDDADGHLWLGTARGILRISLVELHQLFAGQTHSLSSLLLTKDDGMRSSDCSDVSQPSSTRMPDGTLWFTTAGGYVHSTPVAEALGTVNPPVYVRGWVADDGSAPAPLLPADTAVLRPGAPEMLIYFWAKRLSNAGQVEFRYRLEGYDHAWTTTHERVARYRRLPPGRYRFEVQARIGNGDWPQAMAELAVVQKPHLYQTWYCTLAALLLAGAGVWLLLRMRMQRRMQRVKGSMGIVLEERNRIAQECHDTLMAGFAAISWQLEATANLFKDSDAAATPAAKSCELARSMVLLCQAEARRIIYDLRETEEVTNALSKAVRRMLEENHAGPERSKLHFEMQGEEVSLSPGSVHHLTRIAQEAIRNALRHATPEMVRVLLDYRANTILLTIRDDGCGFTLDDAPQARSGHFGIAVMQERARKVGGTFRLESDSNGTEVEVMIPFDAMPGATATDTKEEVVQWIGL
jgi:ligand-binding sensor domain-containing protein/signal transduction histidine kinase